MSLRDSPPVDLLWTGGWDSTFRLLDLVCCRRHPVQPWYVLDRERASTEQELRTMERLQEALAEHDPEALGLLRSPKHVERAAVRSDPYLEALHARTALGSQYGWLPHFAEQYGLSDVELGSVAVPGGKMYELLRRNTERVEGKAGATYRVVATPLNETALLFRRFSFPILTFSKEDLRRRAAACGFLDLMSLTWTCHTPRRGAPCGMCTPCMVMIQSGQARRIPLARRVRPVLRIAKAIAYRRLSSKSIG